MDTSLCTPRETERRTRTQTSRHTDSPSFVTAAVAASAREGERRGGWVVHGRRRREGGRENGKKRSETRVRSNGNGRMYIEESERQTYTRAAPGKEDGGTGMFVCMHLYMRISLFIYQRRMHGEVLERKRKGGGGGGGGRYVCVCAWQKRGQGGLDRLRQYSRL